MIEEHLILVNFMSDLTNHHTNLELTSRGTLMDIRSFPSAEKYITRNIWDLIPDGYIEVQNNIVPNSLENSKLLYNNSNGHFYEKTGIVIKNSLFGTEENSIIQTLHFGIKGDLPEIWQHELDSYLWSQYGPEGNGYITSSGPTRDSRNDLIAWITDDKGSIVASLGLERIVSDNRIPFFDNYIDDQFSSMKFFDNPISKDILKILGYTESQIVSMDISSVGELTRFTVKKYPEDKELSQRARRVDRGLIALALSNGIYRNNELAKKNIHPNVRPINWVLGNIIHNGPARSTVDKFLNGSVRFITKENNPQLKIATSALDPNLPEGYAAEYMKKNSPRIEKNKHEGLSIFIADITNEIKHITDKGRFVQDMLNPVGYRYQIMKYILSGIGSNILRFS